LPVLVRSSSYQPIFFLLWRTVFKKTCTFMGFAPASPHGITPVKVITVPSYSAGRSGGTGTGPLLQSTNPLFCALIKGILRSTIFTTPAGFLVSCQIRPDPDHTGYFTLASMKNENNPLLSGFETSMLYGTKILYCLWS
jgi:hypothetical protein